MSDLVQGLVERIRREGPIPFDGYVEAVLYGAGGFFTRARGAGRAGRDFVTSPEVGPLYGALVSRALDRWWDDLGRPDPFMVVDAGAGRGRLAADVLAAGPECGRALRYVLVERSPELLTAQRKLLAIEPFEDALGPAAHDADEAAPVPVAGVGPIVTALPDLPAVHATGVIVANELLDNLAFRIVERAGSGWLEVRVGHVAGRFVESLVPAPAALAAEADVVAAGPVGEGTRLPIPVALADWLRRCATLLHRGILVVVDYAATGAELAARGEHGWLRTYRGHERGISPLADPGEQDVTIDVPVEYLVHMARRAGFRTVADTTQAEWLRGLGLDDLVADARRQWDARAHVGDLEALRHRSRVSEGSALVDPGGLGAHRVFVFRTG